MTNRIILLSILLSATSALGQSASNCPWFTSGSAEKILGGVVVTTVHLNAATDGSCRFSRKMGEVTQSIDVLVGKASTHPCPEGSPKVKALGNEAVQCTREVSAGQREDTIAGRIRDLYFVVTLTNVPGALKAGPSDPGITDAYDASPLERVAEQVVGNFY